MTVTRRYSNRKLNAIGNFLNKSRLQSMIWICLCVKIKRLCWRYTNHTSKKDISRSTYSLQQISIQFLMIWMNYTCIILYGNLGSIFHYCFYDWVNLKTSMRRLYYGFISSMLTIVITKDFLLYFKVKKIRQSMGWCDIPRNEECYCLCSVVYSRYYRI